MASITTVIPCKGRLEHVRQSVPKLLLQELSADHRVLVVDYDCPDGAFTWCQDQRHPRLDAVRVLDVGECFNLSRARNCGNRVCDAEIVAVFDADCILHCPHVLARMVQPLLSGDARFSHVRLGLDDGSVHDAHSCLMYRREDWMTAGGYEEALVGYGYEDTDFYERMKQRWPCSELQTTAIEIQLLPHDDDLRTRYYDEKNSVRTCRLNRRFVAGRGAANEAGFAEFRYVYYRGDTGACTQGRFRGLVGRVSRQTSPELADARRTAMQKGAPNVAASAGTPVRRFWADHPGWVGEIAFYDNGRMARPRGDAGNYRHEQGRRIVLDWDHWEVEELVWDSADRLYRCHDKRFTLREIAGEPLCSERKATIRPVRVAHLGFWTGFNLEIFEWMFPYLLDTYEFLESDSPELVLVSVYGRGALEENAWQNCIEAARRWPEATRLFFTGENIAPPMDDCEFAISFRRDLDDPRHLRWPLFLPYLRSSGYATSDLVKRGSMVHPPSSRAKFCIFVARNGQASLRNEFVRRLSEYKSVDCAGEVMHNLDCPKLGAQGGIGRARSKIALLEQYKFAISFENASTQGAEGYVTEKLVDAMMAGCMPLYWGDRRVGEDFNTSSFVNMDELDDALDRMVQRVIEIDQDDSLCDAVASQPWLHGNVVPASWNDDRALLFFRRILGAG